MLKNSKAVHLSDDEKKEILQYAKTIVVVGLSPNVNSASYHVASFLLEMGYDVIPIYPKGGEILGKKVYISLKEAFNHMSTKNIQCDVIDIFRKSEALPSVLNEICALRKLNSALDPTESKKNTKETREALNPFDTGSLCVWVQLGLHNSEAAKIAKHHDLLYEEDSCIKLEYLRIFGKKH